MSRPAVTFTLDLEDHRAEGPEGEAAEFRAPAVCRRVLGFHRGRGITGTFFVVGELAERAPDLVREIARDGHEIALHAWRHVPLTELDPDQFREETAKGMALLEDLSGTAVLGYRAPTFSLVPETAWVPAVLADLGFSYSSSVLPARNPLFGWPGAPRTPYRWPSGLLELPAPTAGLGPWRLPYLGGVYFRVLPWAITRTVQRTVGAGPCPWLYCHPYDFDPDEPRWVVPDAGRWGSRLLWMNRSNELAKVDRLLGANAAPPLVERAARLSDVPIVDPAAASSR
jgi:polysaccharide deacetylase family protein (PEP-CTERM system associated)